MTTVQAHRPSTGPLNQAGACLMRATILHAVMNGAQVEALRVPFAGGTLYPLPVGEDDALMPSLLTLSDGAEQIITMGRHADRLALARDFGATDVVSERGEEAVDRVRELTGGEGVHSVTVGIGRTAAPRT